MDKQVLLTKANDGFNTLDVSRKYVDAALQWLEVWLSDQMFSEYVHQIQYLIQNERWNFLLDAFYQVIPFGTGGRRDGDGRQDDPAVCTGSADHGEAPRGQQEQDSLRRHQAPGAAAAGRCRDPHR